MTARLSRVPKGLSDHGPVLALAVVVVTAIGVRLWVLTGILNRLDGDEGVTGVMAQRILDGRFPLFFGSQNYQGAGEQYLQAIVLSALPDTPFTLRLVQVALIAVILVLTYLLCWQVTQSRWAGVLAAALLAVGPYYFTMKGLQSHGGYDGAMLACLIAALAGLRVQAPGRRGVAFAFIAGLAAGIAIWENPTAAYVVAPVALWILGGLGTTSMKRLLAAVGGAVIGLLPVIIHLAGNGIRAPSRTDEQPNTNFVARLRNLFEPVLPDFLGFSSSSAPANPGLPTVALTAAVVTSVVVALVVRRRGIVDLVTLRTARRRPIDLILLTLLITPVLYAASPFTWFTAEPRYLFVLYPFAATAITAGLISIPVLEFRISAVITAIIVATFLPAVALAGTPATHGSVITVRTGPLDLRSVPAVAGALARQGVTHAYANYWIAGPLQFATGNRVQVASGYWSQFPDIERDVRRSRQPAIVVPTNPGAPQVRALLMSSGRRFAEVTAGGFTVFSGITPAWHLPPLSFVLFPS
jgi:hypothetical protein